MKIFSGIAVLAIAAVGLMSSAGAEVIEAGFDVSSVTVGDEVTLRVDVSAEKITGIQFEITYDADVLEYVDSSSGEAFESALASGINNDREGHINVLAAFSNEADVNGSACEIQFNAIGADSEQPVRISNVKLLIDGNKASEEDHDISISVDDPYGNRSSRSAKKKEADVKEEGKDGTENSDSVPEFTDIAGHWAEQYITYIAGEGIIMGMGDGSFAPNDNLTRAQFAQIMSKALDLTGEAKNSYSDVPEGAWYSSAVLKCLNIKLMIGSDGLFRPDDLITREEMAAIMYRAKEYKGIQSGKKSDVTFSDFDTVSEWAKNAVSVMASDGLIEGYDGAFHPKENTTRAAAAVVVGKFLMNQSAE